MVSVWFKIYIQVQWKLSLMPIFDLDKHLSNLDDHLWSAHMVQKEKHQMYYYLCM